MKKGRSKIDRDRASIRDIQNKIRQANAKKTPSKLGMEERFEDVPTKLSDRDRYGTVSYTHLTLPTNREV